MITQCSQCSTKFEISRELVESDDPRVRCGECLSVFNARLQIVPEEQFVEQPEAPVIPTVTQKAAVAESALQTAPAAELESYISADDLENAATIVLDEPSHNSAGISSGVDEFYSPDLQIPRNGSPPVGSENSLLNSTTLEFERTLILDEQDVGATRIAAEQTFESDTDLQQSVELSGQDIPSVALHESEVTDANIDQDVITSGALPSAGVQGASDESAAAVRRHVNQRGGEVVSLVEEAKDRNRSTQQGSMLVPLLTCALALAAVLYLVRDQIAQLDLPEPILSRFCAVAGCELPVQQDLSRLDMLGHKLNSHATLSDVLVIHVDLINRAPFAQPYPVLAVIMKSEDGEVVAEREFQPSDYLEEGMTEGNVPVAMPVRINFEILDPGPAATKSVVVFK